MVKKVKTILPTGNSRKIKTLSFFDLHFSIFSGHEKKFVYFKRSVLYNSFLCFSFTLIEVMITVVILITGILFIYRSFFSSLNISSYAKHYIYALVWSDSKMEDIESNLKRFKIPVFPKTSGVFKMHNKKFLWSLTYSLLAATENMDMYEVDLRIGWKEGKRNVKLEKSTYICYRK